VLLLDDVVSTTSGSLTCYNTIRHADMSGEGWISIGCGIKHLGRKGKDG
jgi:hypothetical protein